MPIHQCPYVGWDVKWCPVSGIITPLFSLVFEEEMTMRATWETSKFQNWSSIGTSRGFPAELEKHLTKVRPLFTLSHSGSDNSPLLIVLSANYIDQSIVTFMRLKVG